MLARPKKKEGGEPKLAAHDSRKCLTLRLDFAGPRRQRPSASAPVGGQPAFPTNASR